MVVLTILKTADHVQTREGLPLCWLFNPNLSIFAIAEH